jgi:hypothetical protein
MSAASAGLKTLPSLNFVFRETLRKTCLSFHFQTGRNTERHTETTTGQNLGQKSGQKIRAKNLAKPWQKSGAQAPLSLITSFRQTNPPLLKPLEERCAMSSRPQYTSPLNEAELFEWGATSWRMDFLTYHAIKTSLLDVQWRGSDSIPRDIEGYIPNTPVGKADIKTQQQIAYAIMNMVNEPSLIPGISQMGNFQISGLEIQNGSYDANWHHDGLAGKRMGHSGDFFAILYFGEDTWDDSWGGHFEYAKRDLSGNWPQGGFDPCSSIRRIAPAERTALIGWNQNPRLIHRAAPLLEAKDRITLIASLDFQPRL